MKKFKKLICTLVLICFTGAIYAASNEVVIDETVLEPKDPILATVIAIGPGLLAHGFGHFMCEDYKMGLTLFSLELISLVAIGIGAAEYAAPAGFTTIGGNTDEVKRSGVINMTLGIGLFVTTWLVDIALAGSAADQYNKEHNLEFKMQQESMGLGSEYALLYNINF
jgi:hypothetical protein